MIVTSNKPHIFLSLSVAIRSPHTADWGEDMYTASMGTTKHDTPRLAGSESTWTAALTRSSRLTLTTPPSKTQHSVTPLHHHATSYSQNE